MRCGYIEFARGLDGSHYLASLQTGIVFHVYIGVITEEYLAVPTELVGEREYVTTITDATLTRAANRTWNNVLAFWKDLASAIAAQR